MCNGQVAGTTVTGPGTIGDLGTAEGTCTSGTGESDDSFALPTSAGPLTVSVRARFVYGPGSGVRLGDQIPGPFEFIATEGDCLTSPVTEVRVINQVIFQGLSDPSAPGRDERAFLTATRCAPGPRRAFNATGCVGEFPVALGSSGRWPRRGAYPTGVPYRVDSAVKNANSVGGWPDLILAFLTAAMAR